MLFKGKRKQASALVGLEVGSGLIQINGKSAQEYLQKNPLFLRIIQKPFLVMNMENQFDIYVQVSGGGLAAQADAIQLGIARALFNSTNLGVLSESGNPEGKLALRANGLLTRDARVKERKKFGLKKSRKASQFSKR